MFRRQTIWFLIVLLVGAVGLVAVSVWVAKILTAGPLTPAVAQFLGFTGGGEYQEIVEKFQESALDPALRREGWRMDDPTDWGEELPLNCLAEGYRLTVGVPEILGRPRQAFERALLVQKDNLWRVVERSGDLEGALAITTASQAIEFVHLLSGPQTFHLWKDLLFVELSVAGIPSSASRSEETAISGEVFFPGVLTPEQAEVLDFHPPETRAEEDGFLITRFVVKREKGGSRVYRLTERISPNGGYEILSAIRQEHDVDVWVPRVE
jgi:hypothetical protein